MNVTLFEIVIQVLQLAAIAAALLKVSTTMTTQFDKLNAQLDAAIAASNETNAANAKLIGIANEIKVRLDAAMVSGSGMAPAEVQTLLDKMADMTVAATAAKTATDAALAAAPPAPVV